MNRNLLRSLRSLASLVLVLLAAVACEDDPFRPDGGTREYAVVVNSVSSSLTVYPIDAPDSTFSIGLHPQGTPVLVALRGDVALVPLGAFPALAVVDLKQRVVARTIPLPAASTPTGVAIVDDSLAFVTLATANAVAPVLYDRGVVLEPIATGTWPEAVVHHEGLVYVLNSRFSLDTFGYEGPGTVTVVDAATRDSIETVQLSGTNPGGAVVLGGSIWVLNRGNYTDIDGSLSEVGTSTPVEVDHVAGFGFGPGGLAAFDGGLAVASFGYGVALWHPATGFVRAPDEGYRPDEETAVADVGTDGQGRLHVVDGQCAAPGGVYVVSESLEVIDHADAEVCPFDIQFTTF